MSEHVERLRASMAKSATGYGAIINGVLDIRSVSLTKSMAAVNALYLQGLGVVSTCTDPDCDCKVKILAEFFPETKIVPVMVQAEPGPSD